MYTLFSVIRSCSRGYTLRILLAAACVLYFASSHQSGRAQGSSNPIQLENAKQGTTAWQLTNPAMNREIEGYASSTSVNRGEQIAFYVNTSEPSYTMRFFRMGWYGGTGAREMTSPATRPGTSQPMPAFDPSTNLLECVWTDPYILNIPYNPADPTDWASGVYLVQLTAGKSGKQTYMIFTVRDDARPSDYLFQSSVTTYAAYNNWGGKSLYGWNSTNGQPARMVSFNRPYAGSPDPAAAFGRGAGDFLIAQSIPAEWPNPKAGWEYNMVRFLEREGCDVSYCTNVDTHARPDMLLSHRGFLVVGHDEYWTWQMRQNVTRARDLWVGLGFFAANIGYWQIRLEPSPANGTPYRTVVGYKDAAYASDPVASDPANSYLTTAKFRDLGYPESALVGGMYTSIPSLHDLVIFDASNWVCAGTGLRNGDVLPGLLGYEADSYNNYAPANTAIIAHSPTGQPSAYGDMTTYTAANGAAVFASGSMQWSWGLDDYNAGTLRPSWMSTAAQQMTRNVLARLATDQSAPLTNLKIESGGSSYTGATSGNWQADSYFSGGFSYTYADRPVANTSDPRLYLTARYGSSFSYSMPVVNGSYTLKLHFAECYHTAAGRRLFNVSINGAQVLANFDIYAAAGANTALVKSFPVTATSGAVRVDFASANQGSTDAIVAAIELVPAGSIPLTARTLLTASAGNGQISLSWTGRAGASSYNLKRANRSGGPYSTIASGISATSYLDPGLTSGSTYYYVVSAITAQGESTNSNEASATPAPPTPVRIQVGGGTYTSTTAGSWIADTYFTSGFTYTYSDRPIANTQDRYLYETVRYGINFSYKIPAINGAYTLKLHFVECYKTAAGGRLFNVILNDNPVLANFDIFASAGGGNIALVKSFPVAVTNGSVNLLFSTAVPTVSHAIVSAIELIPATAPPPAPTNLVAAAGNGQVTLTWTGSAGATSYSIKRAGASGGPYATIASTVTASTYVDAGITNGTTCYYVVSATNPAGESGNSNEASATPLAPPLAPTNLTATPGNAQVTLTWTASAGAASYSIKRAGTSGGPYTTLTSSVTATMYVDPGLTNGATYYYVVSAANAGGSSGNSSQASATPNAPPPPAPTNLSATPGNGQVTLTWTGSAGATSYSIKRAGATGGPYATVASSVSATSYVDPGLTNGTACYYVVSAANSGGSSPNSNEASATPAGPPPAPTNLSATPGNGQVTLTWTASAGAPSHSVKRATVSGGPYGTVVAAVTATIYLDPGLTNGTKYYYVVSATNAGVSSSNSNEASATPAAPPPPPLAPTNLSASPGNGQVALTWTASAGATSYSVKRVNVSGGLYSTLTSAVTSTSYVDPGLTNGITYYYVVSAANAAGQSGNSNEVSAFPTAGTILRINSGGAAYTSAAAATWLGDTYFASGYSYTYSSRPIANTSDPQLYLTARVGAAFSYILPATNGAYNVKLYFAECFHSSAGRRFFNVSVNGSPVLTNFDIYAAAGGANMALAKTFPAAPVNGSVTIAFTSSDPSRSDAVVAAVELQPGAPQAPAAPTLTATAGNAQVTLTWTASTDAASYSVKRASTAGGPYSTVPGAVTATSYVDPGLTNGTTYYYVVSAANAVGQSGNSNEASATPAAPPAPPPAPANLSASPGNGQVTLTWTGSTGATSYSVKRANTTGGSYSVVAAAVTATSYVDPGLTNGTSYYYVVTASSAAGQSGNSNEASATPTAPITPPPAPSNLSATAGNAQVALLWTGSTGATSYSVKRASASGGLYATIAAAVTAASYIDFGLTNGNTYYYVVSATSSGGQSGNSNEASASPSAGPGLRIESGGPAYSSATAGSWLSDTYFSGGYSFTYADRPIASTSDPRLYLTVRVGTAFSYNLPATNGTSLLRLHFAECWHTSAGRRLFNVSINGTPILTNFDIYASAGGSNKALVMSFPVITTNGYINVAFASANPSSTDAILAGLELTSTSPLTTTTKIMPLGDSITDGDVIPGGYRTELWNKLTGSGQVIDFVGSRPTGPPQLPDKDNEGHPGYRIDQIASGINGWLATYNPDVILLVIGTNDVLQGYNLSTAPNRLSSLIDQITSRLPGVRVIVGSITPLTNPDWNQAAMAYNSAIPGIVNSKVAQGQNVSYVDMYGALIRATDLADGIHPTEAGYSKMASVWFSVLFPPRTAFNDTHAVREMFNPYAAVGAILARSKLTEDRTGGPGGF